MFNELSSLSPEALLGVIGIISGCAVLLVALLAGYMLSSHYQENKAHQAEAELNLKAEMIKRGMSADEIVKVIEASPGGNAARKA